MKLFDWTFLQRKSKIDTLERYKKIVNAKIIIFRSNFFGILISKVSNILFDVVDMCPPWFNNWNKWMIITRERSWRFHVKQVKWWQWVKWDKAFREYVSYLKDTKNIEYSDEKTMLRILDFSTKREIRDFQQRLFGVV